MTVGAPIEVAEFTERQIASIWRKVDRTGGPDAHWWWLACGADASRMLMVNGRNYTGRRVIWTLVNGPLPERAQIFNVCGERSVCEPSA